MGKVEDSHFIFGAAAGYQELYGDYTFSFQLLPMRDERLPYCLLSEYVRILAVYIAPHNPSDRRICTSLCLSKY